jgi:hypothetical protein
VKRYLLSEPVRAYVYGIAVPAGALAVGYGLLTWEEVALWLALLAPALAVPAAELARSRVTPTGDADL